MINPATTTPLSRRSSAASSGHPISADYSTSSQQHDYPDASIESPSSSSPPSPSNLPSSPISNSMHQPKPPQQSTAMDGYESILRFLLLPSQVGVVLLLEFLNSFR